MAAHHAWQPPRPHGDVRANRLVGPLELFYDLVVVVMVGQAAHEFAQNLSLTAAWNFLAVLGLTWIAWLNGTVHHDLHGRDDARNRVVILVQMLLLTPMAAFITHADAGTGGPFAVCGAILFGFFTLLWAIVSRHDDRRYRRANRSFVALTAGCALTLAATAVAEPRVRLVTWTALIGVYFASCLLITAGLRSGQSLGLDVSDALAERFGLFTIIVLGETVVGVVHGMVSSELGLRTVVVGIAAVVVGFGSWWTYFDFTGHRLPRQGRYPPMVWMLAHFPVAAAIATMGASMVGLVEESHHPRLEEGTVWALVAGSAGLLLSTGLLATTLVQWREEPGVYRSTVKLSVATAGAVLVLGWFNPAVPVLLVALIVAFSIPWTNAVLRRIAVADRAEPASRG